ncbi:MAG TPA: NADH-quinone oxidoreductase subunit NuoB [Acidiferrobacter sp.]|nr:NADH-quinone oxidoreductase subunit NuoB [Acidiferrobacter sp.]
MHKLIRRLIATGLVSTPRPSAAELTSEARQSAKALVHRLGRALAVRHVDAGSCNGCELEIHALSNPYYNLEGLGIHFVASPRHADILMVTGPVSHHMVAALLSAYDALPDPKLVLALGDCATGNGIFGANYATVGQVSAVLPVDITIPGCPPTPTAILAAFVALAEAAIVPCAGTKDP